MRIVKVCIVGASGKLGQNLVRHCLDRAYEVVGVCREESVAKLHAYEGRITIVPGATDDPEVVREAVAGCDGVLVVLVPPGMRGYSTETAQAVLDHAPKEARLVFSCGWHVPLDGRDRYSIPFRAKVKVLGWIGKLTRVADLGDQEEACRRIFASDTRWTSYVAATSTRARARACRSGAGTSVTRSSRATSCAASTSPSSWSRRSSTTSSSTRAPAIVGRETPSALAHAQRT